MINPMIETPTPTNVNAPLVLLIVPNESSLLKRGRRVPKMIWLVMAGEEEEEGIKSKLIRRSI